MRLTGSRAYYRSTPPKMPSGLVELIEGLTREVLKNNPADIYGFCAGHMQHLLEIRDGPLQKKTLTLDEKIAKAQKRVRQRAEQRRKQYNNDLFIHQKSLLECSDKNGTSTSKDATPSMLSQEPTAFHVVENPAQKEQDLGNLETELSHELCTQSDDPQYQKNEDLATKDNDNLINDIKSEPQDKEYESKIYINSTESTNEISDSISTQDTALIEISKTETPASKVEILDNFCPPMEDGEMQRVETQSVQEGQIFVAETGVMQEFDSSSEFSDPGQHLSRPINSNNSTQDKELDLEDTADLDVQNSVTQAANEISKEMVETQIDVNLSLNKEIQSNDTENMQQYIEPDFTNGSNISNNVELITNNDDNVNKENENGNEENDRETDTFDISYKESPPMELKDSEINSDMVGSLLQTNPDSDVITLITQQPTNGQVKQHNAFKNDTEHSELPGSHKDNSNTNGIISERDEDTLQQNQINNISLIENNKENSDIDYSGYEYTSAKLEETQQIHNQDSNMDLETAAVTIQKVFRSFLFKSRASTFDDTVNDETIFLNEAEKNKKECDFPIAGSLNERRPHGITRMDTVLQTVNEEKSLSLSTDDSSTMSSAATVIQAHVRGFLVRNKLNSNKTISTNSLAASNSNEPSLTSLDMDNEQNKNKTVLNIHIVPEGGNYLSRDESLITSMDLSLDSSPPSSINLHPLGYDKSERRKQLKREDAIQSISPPSNNSGKLSEDVDSVKELPLNDHEIAEQQTEIKVVKDDLHEGPIAAESIISETTVSNSAEIAIKEKESAEKNNYDEMDVVTPFILNEVKNSSGQTLMHSGEFHDPVLPTKVSRNDTSVASEFKNVLVYFLLWNNS